MTVEIFYIILAVIFGILAYIHYNIDKQRKELNSLWVQIAILASATAEKLNELKKEQKNKDGK